MLFTIAWRNVWRNRKRSGVIICAIAFGLWAGLLISGLMYGMGAEMIQSAMSDRIAHVQIHRPGFLAHRDITLVIPDGERVLASVRSAPLVRSAAARSVVSAMASSPTTGLGVVAYGIEPADEVRVSDIHSSLVEGSYFPPGARDPVVIGKRLAEKLGVGLGGKIVLTAQDADGSISAGAFRIVGIFSTVSSTFDQTAVFAERRDIDRVFDLHGGIHEIAVIATDVRRIAPLAAELRGRFPALDVETWKALAPELGLMTDTTLQFLYIFLVIVLLALAFGTTNTMLMGVMERVRELGVIIALGMRPRTVFLMIVLETVFLALVGGAAGIALGLGTIAVLARTGIDLAIVSSGLASFGSSEILHPALPAIVYPLMALFVVATAIAAALYPGIRAVRLEPAKAIRTY
jgi:putative ABC transport system permease protein